MIKVGPIKKYLKEVPQNYLTFDIAYTQNEIKYLNEINILTESIFDHIGHIDNLKYDKLSEFVVRNTDVSDSNIFNNILRKLINNVCKAYDTKYCWMTIRITLPNSIFDIPRWHKDGNFFSTNRIQSKFITVLKGPGTLFIKKSKKPDDIYNDNRDSIREEYKKLLVNGYSREIEYKYQKVLAKKLKSIKSNYVKDLQGLIFLVGSDKNNVSRGLLHSEPKMDVPRIFISILPGSESEILELEKRWAHKFT